MNVFSMRFNKFDIFVIIMGILITLAFVVKSTACQSMSHIAYAFMTLLITVMYAKAASIHNDL